MTKKKFKLLAFDKKKNSKFSCKRKIIITDFLLNIFIGYRSHEKINKQNVKFNIELDHVNPKHLNDKDIKSIFNYEKITKIVKNLTKSKHYNFLETLAEDVFDELFKDKRIDKITLQIEKLEIMKDCSSVGIQISKKRSHDKL